MVFGDDTDASLVAAAALVNTTGPPDTLTTAAELDAFYTEHGYTGSRARDAAEPGRRPRGAGAAARAADRRPGHRRGAGQPDPGRARAPPPAGAPRPPRLPPAPHGAGHPAGRADRRRDGHGDDRRDPGRRDEPPVGLRRPDLRGVVVDLSRNRSRRFCSTTCGNRVAVAAYRARRG
jgi:hypothetical protein